jgi:hypothetical protein
MFSFTTCPFCRRALRKEWAARMSQHSMTGTRLIPMLDQWNECHNPRPCRSAS